MVDLRERFESFGDVDVPDLWERIESEAMQRVSAPGRRWHPLAVMASAAVLVLLIGALTWTVRGLSSESSPPPGGEPTPVTAPDLVPTVAPSPDVTGVTNPPVTAPLTTDAPSLPDGTADSSVSLVSNNALGTGPAVFVGVGGLPGAFLGADLVACLDEDCGSTNQTPLTALSGFPAIEPLVLPDGSLAALARTESGALDLVHCTDAACSDAVAIRLADEVDFWNSSISADGRLVVVYGLPWGTSPEPPGSAVVTCVEYTCSESDPETTALGALPGPDPMYSRIAVDGDRLAYAYRTGDAALIFVTCLDLSCSQATTVEVVSAAGEEGWMDVFDMAIGADGLPVIAYGWMSDPRQLRVIHCESWDCAARADTAVIELSGYWQGASLGIGADGYPIMAYASNESITVTKCQDPACTSVVTSAPLGATPGDPSLAVGSNGIPVIAYYIEGTASVDYEANPDLVMPEPVLALFRCLDAACTAPVD